MPTAEAPGKLKNRDDKKLVGTDKEKVSNFLYWVKKNTAQANLLAVSRTICLGLYQIIILK